MKKNDVVFTVSRRGLRRLVIAMALLGTLLFLPPIGAQKVQEVFADKFKVTDDHGGVSVTTSADGKYVYVAGKKGVLVSHDYGKTGTWVQTVRMK